jgi:hypothetical protein
MFIFSVLIYIVSLTLKLPVTLKIHNQSQNINLASPVYFNLNGKWHVAPDSEIGVNAVMESSLESNPDSLSATESDPEEDTMNGALIYKIQRQNAKFSRAEDVYLLVIWRVKGAEEPSIYALLIEYKDRITKAKMKRICRVYWSSIEAMVNPTRGDWRLDDATMLTTRVKVVNGGYRWDIFVSDGVENEPMDPLEVDPNR